MENAGRQPPNGMIFEAQNLLWVWEEGGRGGGHCNLCHSYARSVDFVYFVIPILWSRPFLMSLMNFSFMLPCFQQNLSHLIEQIPTMLDFKLAESNPFKVEIKSRTWLAWNADMWLRNLPKTACATLSPFQMSNRIAKFSSWKLIATRWIIRQHKISVITTYFKYLIRQFNSTSEWDLIWVKVQKHPSREVFLGKGVLKICIKFTGEHLCRSVISIKLQRNFI